MGTVSGIKRTDKTAIECDGSLILTLGLVASPGIFTDPAQVVLVLDRSGSMSADKLASMKKGAIDLIGMISSATGGSGTTIAHGSRVGLVSFSDDASVDSALTTDVAALNAAVQACTSFGNTNHLAAFTTAKTVFDFTFEQRKLLVFFTDGYTSVMLGDPDPAVEDLKASGVEIFCLGLNAREETLRKWASEPKDTHLAYTTDITQLERLFAQVGKTVVDTGAVNAVLQDEISPDFEIVSMAAPTMGTARFINNSTIRWTIDELGVSATQTATLDLTLRHVGTTEGVKFVNKQLVYEDSSGAAPAFDNPTVTVKSCGGDTPVYPEPCPVPTSFEIAGCQDAAIIDLDHTQLTSLGRVVQLNATLKNICPGKRVALGVLLTEIAPDGTEHSRGLKTVTIPAHTGTSCQDVQVKCIRFVVPEDLDVSGGSPSALCNARSFSARVMANYIDTDFACCDGTAIL